MPLVVLVVLEVCRVPRPLLLLLLLLLTLLLLLQRLLLPLRLPWRAWEGFQVGGLGVCNGLFYMLVVVVVAVYAWFFRIGPLHGLYKQALFGSCVYLFFGLARQRRQVVAVYAYSC